MNQAHVQFDAAKLLKTLKPFSNITFLSENGTVQIKSEISYHVIVNTAGHP